MFIKGVYMIDATRVRMMTKLAVYESGEGKKELKMHRYSKRTYLSLKQLESFFAMTLAYFLGAVLYSSRYYSEIVTKGLAFDYRQLILHMLCGYVIVTLLNFIVTDWICRRKYDRMTVHVEEYDKNLYALKTYLEREEMK